MEDRDDRDDEKPVVVVLADGDLSATEVDRELQAAEEAAPTPGTKIMFKKPAKRASNDDKAQEDSSSGTKKAKKDKKKAAKSLLSFDDEDVDS